MKRFLIERGLSLFAIAVAVLIKIYVYQNFDPEASDYAKEICYNLDSVAEFIGMIVISLNIKKGNFVRVGALVWGASFFFNMITELTSFNDLNSVVQWAAYWFIVTMTFIYGVTEYNFSKRN